MFASNQVLELSGDYSQLKKALEFAIEYAENRFNHLVYQITEDGRYCIGWSPQGNIPKGWQKFSFDFDAEIVSRIIIQTLEKHHSKSSLYDGCDGSTDYGFLMEVIPQMFSDEYEGIKNPFYGIVSFKSYKNFYAK